ncbi:MAG: hypothetical protein PWP51_1236 [Clostridiales bacterium]|nr:hypothetical protein [Clostridiales bacterium]MDN5298683.1 hypothetical protein [Clostridiales bacterium]
MNLLVFEYASISEGMKTCDYALKNFMLNLVKHDIRCPGRYSCLLEGSEANIKRLGEHLMANTTQKCLSVKSVYHLSDGLLEARNTSVEPGAQEDLLIVETKHLVDSYYVLDQLIKRTALTQYAILDRLGLFGKGVVIVAGKSQSIKQGLSMTREASFEKMVWQSEVIQNPAMGSIRF